MLSSALLGQINQNISATFASWPIRELKVSYNEEYIRLQVVVRATDLAFECPIGWKSQPLPHGCWISVYSMKRGDE